MMDKLKILVVDDECRMKRKLVRDFPITPLVKTRF